MLELEKQLFERRPVSYNFSTSAEVQMVLNFMVLQFIGDDTSLLSQSTVTPVPPTA